MEKTRSKSAACSRSTLDDIDETDSDQSESDDYDNTPILPECCTFGYFDFLDLDCLEVARQLTVVIILKLNLIF